MKVLVINGPNLNMLGRRDPAVYGAATLAEIEEATRAATEPEGIETEWFQSDIEGEIVSKLHEPNADAVVINAGAYTHYSIAIRDALDILTCPKIELHISNVFAREEYRRHSVLSEVCTAVMAGLGADGYKYAVIAAAERARV